MSNVKMDKRPYRSPLRQEQAEATRQRILDAGLALFAERGYPGTSVTPVAAAAGVSAETIYASVGSKRGIIDAHLAKIDTERVGDRARTMILERGGGPRDGLEVLAELAVRFWAANHVLVGVLRNGIGDPEIGGAWLQRQAQRRELIAALIGTWPRAALRPGLDPEQAKDLAWSMTSDELFGLLVGLRGWSVDAYLAWLKDALVREILADPPIADPATA
jgi:AcrR family transcriptional regulator